MSFLVWCPDRGHTEDDGLEMREVRDPQGAAELYAEVYAGFDGDPFEEITVHVRKNDKLAGRDDAKTYAVTVVVRCEPVFLAGRPAEVKGDDE